MYISMNSTLIKENIIELLGLSELPLETQADMLDKMADLVMRRLMIRLIENMSDEDKEEVARVFESGTDEEKTSFMTSRFPDLRSMIEEEVITLKAELVNEVENIDETLGLEESDKIPAAEE